MSEPQEFQPTGDFAANIQERHAGEKFVDRYTLISELGAGGMGSVWEAQASAMNTVTGAAEQTKVAIKLMRPQLIGQSAHISRFAHEAEVLERIDHKNVVKVLEHGSTADGIRYVVMEYVRGVNLAKLIEANEMISPRRAAEITRDVADALVACHEKRVIHRDVKPANIIVSRDQTKLVDFGLAGKTKHPEAWTQTVTQVTQTGQIFGTPRYMSPEQAIGARVGEGIGEKTDVYSLGATLFSLLTLEHPYPEISTDGLLIMRLRERKVYPLDARGRRSELEDLVGGNALCELLLKATKLEASERLTMTEFLSELSEILSNPKALIQKTWPGRIRPYKRPLGYAGGVVALAVCVLLLLIYNPFGPPPNPKVVFESQVALLPEVERASRVVEKLLEINLGLSRDSLKIENSESVGISLKAFESEHLRFLWPLKHFPELRVLELESDTPGEVLDLSELSGLELFELSIGGHKVDLDTLPPMPLVRLSLRNCGVSSIAKLSGLELRELDLGDNAELTDVSALKSMQLQVVKIDGTGVLDIGALRKSAETLKELHCERTGIQDFSAIKGSQSLRLIRSDSWPGDDFLKLPELEIFTRLQAK